MFIPKETLATALSALAFLSHAIPSSAAGFGRPAHGIHHARSLRPADNARIVEKRTDPACAASALNVAQLHNEYAAFQGWVNAWLQTAVQEDAATAIAQLKQEFSAYDSWMNTWLDSALSGSAGPSVSASPPGQDSPPSQVSIAPLPQSTSIASSQGLTAPIGATRSFLSIAPYPTGPVSQGAGGTAALSGTGSRSTRGLLQSGSMYPRPTGIVPVGTAPGLSAVSSAAASSAAVSSAAASSAVASSAASGPSSSPSSPAGSGSFNAKAKDNVVVYYGQTAATTSVKMTDLCSDKDVDIVILSFLTTFAGPGGYPTVNFGAACGGSVSSAATAKGATGLLSCPDLGKDIQTCQAAGKKVMLSLGGAEAESAFTSDDQATKFATQLWDLFGSGTGEDAGLRPFGAGVSVDGFDLDNENKKPDHYATFVAALRKTFKGDSSKSYYISAAPQCPTPDASIPLDAMKLMDFVFVQFYNNGNCNVGQAGFVDSFKTWTSQLSDGPMVYIGAPACGGTACAGSGYVPPAQIGDVIKSAQGAGASNMGGVMLWDGAEGFINKDGGSDNYMAVVKKALA